jgi:fucose 4-O-acetylase-like acetyltransferase
MRKRDLNIDFLRALAIVLMIWIHACFYNNKQPYYLWNYAYFSVPLLVFCSGYVTVNKVKGRNFLQSFQWVARRILRILLPYYLFLFIVGVTNIVVSRNLTITTAPALIKQALFIGNPFIYWVVLLFLGLTVLTPAIMWINQWRFGYLFLLLIAFISSILTVFFRPNRLFYLYFLIPWLTVFLVGMKYQLLRLNKYRLNWLIILTLVISIVMFYILRILHYSTVLRANKYPPNLYYLSYGLFWIFVLIRSINLKKSNPIVKQTITFISLNSYLLFYLHYWLIIFTYGSIKEVVYHYISNPDIAIIPLYAYLLGTSLMIAYLFHFTKKCLKPS